jgi:hypothetical protein
MPFLKRHDAVATTTTATPSPVEEVASKYSSLLSEYLSGDKEGEKPMDKVFAPLINTCKTVSKSPNEFVNCVKFRLEKGRFEAGKVNKSTDRKTFSMGKEFDVLVDTCNNSRPRDNEEFKECLIVNIDQARNLIKKVKVK